MRARFSRTGAERTYRKATALEALVRARKAGGGGRGEGGADRPASAPCGALPLCVWRSRHGAACACS